MFIEHLIVDYNSDSLKNQTVCFFKHDVLNISIQYYVILSPTKNIREDKILVVLCTQLDVQQSSITYISSGSTSVRNK